MALLKSILLAKSPSALQSSVSTECTTNSSLLSVPSISNNDNCGELTATPREKKLKYGMVEIHRFNIIIGPSPSCADGPPIGLGCECVEKEEKISLDDYESLREGKRRSSNDLYLSTADRLKLLKAFEVPIEEISKGRAECQKDHKQWMDAMIEQQKKVLSKMKKKDLLITLKEKLKRRQMKRLR